MFQIYIIIKYCIFLAAATSVSVLWVLIVGGNYTVWS